MAGLLSWDDFKNDPTGFVGTALAGPSAGIADLTGPQRSAAGQRALLNFGLTMLANSGYSAQPRTFGQILAPSMAAAQETMIGGEQIAAHRAASGLDTQLKLAEFQDKRGESHLKRLETQMKILELQRALGAIGALTSQTDQTFQLGGGGGGAPADIPIVGDVPEAGRPLMKLIAGRESQGVPNRLYGGGSFDGYQAFPVWPGATGPTGQPTHAAGKYQFQPGTWADITGGGKVDFSEKNQDTYAWKLAQREYQRATGRDLARDAGDPTRQAAIHAALAPTWPTLAPLARQGAAGTPPGRVQTAAAAPTVLTSPAPGAPPPAASPGAPNPGLQAPPLRLQGGASWDAPPGAGPAAAGPPVAPSYGSDAPPAGLQGMVQAAAAPAATPARAEAPAPGAPGSAPPEDVYLTESLAALGDGHKAAFTAHQQQARAARASGDVKALEKVNADWTKVQTEFAQSRQKLIAESIARRATLKADEDKDRRAIAAKEAEARAASELERQKADSASRQSVQNASLAIDTERLKKTNERTATAQDQLSSIAELEALVGQLGPGNWMLALSGTGEAGARMMAVMETLKLGTPETLRNVTSQRAFQQIVDRVAGSLRPVGSGALSDREMDQYRRSFPALAQSPQGRVLALAMLRAAAERKIEEGEFANDYFMEKKTTVGMVKEMDAKLGRMIQEPPKPTGNLETDSIAAKAYLGGMRFGVPFGIYDPDSWHLPKPRLTWAVKMHNGTPEGELVTVRGMEMPNVR